MNDKSDVFRTAQQARIRALVIPREHGAWGLLLVPLFTGVVAGYASEHRILPLLVFTVTALSLFWLRTPLESLIGTSSLTVNTERERWTALIASTLLATRATTCLAGLMWKGQNLQLLLLGGATALAFLIQSALRILGRKTRMAAQMVGAIGLVCTAPAAYYIGTGRLDKRALILWLANWIFAGNQIHFVQLRIHSARATTFSQKLAHGKFFLLAQPVLFASLVFAAFWRVIPPLAIVAFFPALLRGTLWFLTKPEPLDVRRLGWSEMKQGVALGCCLRLLSFTRNTCSTRASRAK
jgi:YwiC-like protein